VEQTLPKPVESSAPVPNPALASRG
jgi:hypothetical protein